MPTRPKRKSKLPILKQKLNQGPELVSEDMRSCGSWD